MRLKKLPLLVDIAVITILGSISSVKAAGDPQVVLKPLADFITLVKALGVAVALLSLFVAAIQFMAAGDNPEKKHSAKQYLTGAVFGIIIFASAPLISAYFLGG